MLQVLSGNIRNTLYLNKVISAVEELEESTIGIEGHLLLEDIATEFKIAITGTDEEGEQEVVAQDEETSHGVPHAFLVVVDQHQLSQSGLLKRKLKQVRGLKSDPPGPHVALQCFFLFWTTSVLVLKRVFVFRTYTTGENNDHLFGRGPGGSKVSFSTLV